MKNEEAVLLKGTVGGLEVHALIQADAGLYRRWFILGLHQLLDSQSMVNKHEALEHVRKSAGTFLWLNLNDDFASTTKFKTVFKETGHTIILTNKKAVVTNARSDMVVILVANSLTEILPKFVGIFVKELSLTHRHDSTACLRAKKGALQAMLRDTVSDLTETQVLSLWNEQITIYEDNKIVVDENDKTCSGSSAPPIISTGSKQCSWYDWLRDNRRPWRDVDSSWKQTMEVTKGDWKSQIRKLRETIS
jgi:hypothetical protein